jgi:hypothetical protein
MALLIHLQLCTRVGLYVVKPYQKDAMDIDMEWSLRLLCQASHHVHRFAISIDHVYHKPCIIRFHLHPYR